MSAIRSVTATINGTEYTLSYNSSTEAYEASITAPAKSSYSQTGHYYGVTVNAVDVAGNSTTVNASDETYGAALQLRVKEKVKPVVSFTTPTNGSGLTNNKPVIKLNVTDADSGVDLSTFALKIDSGAEIPSTSCTTTAITNGYTVTYTPSAALTDGSHTITARVSDYDGNVSDTASITIKIDTVPPTLSLSGPSDNSYTNNNTCTITGTTNDATSSPVSVTITVNGTSAGAVTVSSNGVFSKSVTLNEGANTIVVTSTDSLGKSTSVNRTVTLDTVAPVFSSVAVSPNPVDAGATYKISVKVTS